MNSNHINFSTFSKLLSKDLKKMPWIENSKDLKYGLDAWKKHLRKYVVEKITVERKLIESIDLGFQIAELARQSNLLQRVERFEINHASEFDKCSATALALNAQSLIALKASQVQRSNIFS